MAAQLPPQLHPKLGTVFFAIRTEHPPVSPGSSCSTEPEAPTRASVTHTSRKTSEKKKKRNKEKQNKKRTLAGPCGDAVVRRWDTLALMNCMCSKKRRPKDGDIYLPREFSLPSTLVRSSFLFILIFFSSSVLLRRAPWPALPRCARTHARTLDEMLHLHMQMDYAGVTRMDVCVTWRRGADVSTLTSFLF